MYEEKIYKDIEKIKWFSKCGKNIPYNIGFLFSSIKSWIDALKSTFNDNWQDINMDENGKLINIIQVDPEYDEKYEIYSGFYTKRILPLIQEYSLKKNIDFSISTYIRWAVINSLMEETYKEKYNLIMFFSRLLKVYKKGHFPCGWDGYYPDGNLLIY